MLETPNANLVAGMAWLQSTYTIRLNHRHKLFGHVFSGRYKGAVELVSGKYAMIETSGLGFALVPWRPVIEHELGRNISGIMHGDNISWELGRSRDLGIGL